ncbi:hypothetical protein WI84_24215 [Burkholderia ubonensis]|nr:hypothetical protein WI84_24215 [Burkholderia ubonensis]
MKLGSFSDWGCAVKSVSIQDQSGVGKIEKTRIDGHLLGAKMFACIGIVPVVFYWFAFRAFGSSGFPWMCALAIEIFCPIFAYVHYFLNRRAKRLVWAGASVCIGFFPVWLLLGSYWLFYFCWAPMPSTIRAVALPVCFAAAIGWAWLTWHIYGRETRRLGLTERLFRVESDRIVYPVESDTVIGTVEGPGASITIPYWLVSTVGPILIGYAMLSGRVFEKTGGPHGVFIILSAFSLPITCWLVSRIFVRFAYFQIYLPLKLERETGKKVIFER